MRIGENEQYLNTAVIRDCRPTGQWLLTVIEKVWRVDKNEKNWPCVEVIPVSGCVGRGYNAVQTSLAGRMLFSKYVTQYGESFRIKLRQPHRRKGNVYLPSVNALDSSCVLRIVNNHCSTHFTSTLKTIILQRTL